MMLGKKGKDDIMNPMMKILEKSIGRNETGKIMKLIGQKTIDIMVN